MVHLRLYFHAVRPVIHKVRNKVPLNEVGGVLSWSLYNLLMLPKIPVISWTTVTLVVSVTHMRKGERSRRIGQRRAYHLQDRIRSVPLLAAVSSVSAVIGVLPMKAALRFITIPATLESLLSNIWYLIGSEPRVT